MITYSISLKTLKYAPSILYTIILIRLYAGMLYCEIIGITGSVFSVIYFTHFFQNDD